MTAVSQTPPAATDAVLPRKARQRLIQIAVGWCMVAMLEAAAYIAVAAAMTTQSSPGWVITSAIIAVLATVWVTRSGFFSGVRLAGDLYAALGRTLAEAKLSWFTEANRAQVALFAGRGIPGFMSIPAHQLQALLHAPLIPLFLVIGLWWLQGAEPALLTGGLLALSLFIQFKAQRALSQADRTRQVADKGAAQAITELVDHLELLRCTLGPGRAIARLEQQWDTQEMTLAGTNLAAAKATLISAFASALPLAGVAGYLAMTTSNSPAMTLALLLIVVRSSAPLAELALTGLSINDLKATFRDYQQLVSVPTLSEPTHSSALQPQGEHISIKQVSHAPALREISTEIRYGEHVVIIGPSGCGKSTLLELLMRFDDPQYGEITLGGVPLPHIRYADLTANMAYVAQDPIVFTGTLAENIRLGRPDADDESVSVVARQAMLGHVIDRSSQGIHQSVGLQGGALSGGERQRVAIARALLKAAPILILDEATSALDQETEQQIAKVIRDLATTVITVTHRAPELWQPTLVIDLASARQGRAAQDTSQRQTVTEPDMVT